MTATDEENLMGNNGRPSTRTNVPSAGLELADGEEDASGLPLPTTMIEARVEATGTPGRYDDNSMPYLPYAPEQIINAGPPTLSGEIVEGGLTVGPEEIDASVAPLPTLIGTFADSKKVTASKKRPGKGAAGIEFGSIRDSTPPAPTGLDSVDDDVPYDFITLEDSDAKKLAMGCSPSQAPAAFLPSGGELSVAVYQNSDHDNIPTDQDVDEESPRANVNVSRANNASRSGLGQQCSNESLPIIPEAFLEEGRGQDVNNLPWWKQRRAKILLSLICILAVVAIVSISASLSRDGTNTVTQVSIPTDPSDPPSVSMDPSSPPSLQPTITPSSSQVPSYSPTSCADIVSSMAQSLDLPFDDPSNPRMSVDGRNAAVVAREGTSDTIFLTFYSLNTDDNEWSRKDVFTLQYPDDNYEFAVDLSDSTALLGLPLNRDGSGLVYIFELNSMGLWELIDEPLIPEGEVDGAKFGYRVNTNGELAVVSAFDDKAFYLFQKNSAKKWTQLSKVDLDYNPSACFLSGQFILIADVASGNIHFYQYDKDLDRVVTLQQPIVSNPNLEEYEELENQIMASGAGRIISGIIASDDYLVYSTMVCQLNLFAGDCPWVAEGVHIYKRQDAHQNFTLLQFINSSDYDEGFGWNLGFGQDILLVGAGNVTNAHGKLHVFSKRDDYFEESFVVDGNYDKPRLSGRRLIAFSGNQTDNKLVALNLQDCTQQMPTQLPSSSLAPISMPSTPSPTSSALPTSTSIPSPAPSFSLVPSASIAPSQTPTSSSAPTFCYNVKLAIMTTGANTEGFEDDVTSWELYERRSGKVIMQGGQFQEDEIDEYEANCLQESDYVFSISNSNGNGFGECSTCGYFLFVNDIPIGGSTSFYDNEKFTFTVPVHGDNAMSLCSGDFFFSLYTDGSPEEIMWKLATDEGITVLYGGPYQKAFATYREFACLPNGEYTFTILDSGGGGSSPANVGSYFFGINHNQLLDGPTDLNFGTSRSKTFVLGR